MSSGETLILAAISFMIGMIVYVTITLNKLKDEINASTSILKTEIQDSTDDIITEIQSIGKTVSSAKETQTLMFSAITDERLVAAQRATEVNDTVYKLITEKMTALEKTLRDAINERTQAMQSIVEGGTEKTNTLHKEVLTTITQLTAGNKEAQLELTRTLSESLTMIHKMNETKLDEINTAMSEKLDRSLNERLDSSFKQVGEQLGDLYKTLGELNSLSSGVNDLNKTLSNVKTRGIFGEQQLAAILENTMTPAQYETNVATKKNSSDVVEFAIKIPSKGDDKEMVLLPIDSKFPTDIYNRIVSASETGDTQALLAATKELEQRIKQEARTIRDKYINPPITTDFAVMFLPTESLYSEVLRIDGLTEWCQTNCKIIISGPTTITALLNSLRVGFSNLTLNKKTQEVIKVLQAVKTQYSTLSGLIEKTQKKLSDAVASTEALKSRTDIIQRRMGKIETLETSDADKILALSDSEQED